MKTETMLIGAAIVGGILLLTKGKAGNYVGQSIGNAAGGIIAGSTEGVIESILIDPYNWAGSGAWVKNDAGSYSFEPTIKYIPIIDELAQGAVSFKNLGDPNRWLW